MNQKSIPLYLTIFVVILGSIFLGTAVGQSDQITPLIGVSILAVLLISVSLGDKAWILIPIFWSWTGKIYLLPIPFSVFNLVTGLAIGLWLLNLAVRKGGWKFQFEKSDIVIGLTLFLLLVTYARNPVGIAAFGGDGNVGGRPYAELMIAVFAYILLSGQRTELAHVKSIPKWVLVSTFVIAVGGTVALLIPQVGIVLYQFYSGFSPNVSDLLDPYGSEGGIGRASFLRPFAFAAVAYVGAKQNPLKLLRPNNWWMIGLLMLAAVMALASGFRSAVVAIGFYFVCATWFWLRGIGLFICGMAASIFIIIAISAQAVVPLPDQVQRSLSFLPGPWDQHVIRDGENSTEWRMKMWEMILEGDSIKNWWIGDGFGVPRSEQEYFGYLQKAQQIRPEQLAEYYMITGELHSGPLSAAKYAGIIGGILFVLLAIIIFVRYVKTWKRLVDYPELLRLRQLIGFYGVMACYFPFKFLFVAGFYDRELPTLIISAGLCRLLCGLAEQKIIESDSAEQTNEAFPDARTPLRNLTKSPA